MKERMRGSVTAEVHRKQPRRSAGETSINSASAPCNDTVMTREEELRKYGLHEPQTSETQALCAQVDKPDMFFLGLKSSNDAIAICGLCRVSAECLQRARDRGEEYGVWGGVHFSP